MKIIFHCWPAEQKKSLSNTDIQCQKYQQCNFSNIKINLFTDGVFCLFHQNHYRKSYLRGIDMNYGSLYTQHILVRAFIHTLYNRRSRSAYTNIIIVRRVYKFLLNDAVTLRSHDSHVNKKKQHNNEIAK